MLSGFVSRSLTAAILVLSLARLALVSAEQIRIPHDLAYESPIQRSVDIARAGENLYDPAVYDDGPFVLTMYTPLYFWLASVLPTHPSNPFLASRILAAAAMLLSACTLLLVVPRRKMTYVAGMAVGAFFLPAMVVFNATLARNDSLGLLLSALAVVLVARTGASARALPVVAALCCLAFWTKQTQLAASAACLLYVGGRSVRRATGFAALLALLFGASALLAHLCLGEGLWFSTLVAPRNPFGTHQWLRVWRSLTGESAFLGTLAVIVWLAWRAWRRRDRGVLTRSPFPLYVIATSPSFLLVGKLGAGTNYVFEFYLASLMWIVHELSAIPMRRRAAAGMLLLVLLTTTREVGLRRIQDYSLAPWANSAPIRTLRATLAKDMASISPRPTRALNLMNAAWTYDIGATACNDPYLYSLLWTSGTLDPRSITTALELGSFEAVVVPSTALATPHGAESAGLLDVMRVAAEHYPRRLVRPQYQVWLRAQP